MLVGHQEVVESLSSQLPPVSIITGPPSVGKRMIAAYAAMKNSISRIDFTEVTRLTVDEAARVKEFIASEPMSRHKFVLIDLDAASSRAIDKLLITLEQPPTYARFAITTSQPVPRTLLTRGWKYPVGLLEPEDLQTILLNKGIPVADAVKLCHLGRVDVALNAYANSAARMSAINVLQAVESGDHILFMQACKGMDEQTANFIVMALQEAVAQSWNIFSAQQLGVFAERKVALQVLMLRGTVANARPQLAVKSALESIMRG